jgi:hypothetical protein
MATSQDIYAFRGRFPELTATDAQIAAVLNTADIWLENNSQWSTRDFNLARQYWAAHLMVMQQMQGSGSTSEIAGVSLADMYVSSVKIGERTVTFQQRQSLANAEANAGPGETMLSATMYGQLFLQLRARNIIPVAIV